MPNTDHLIEQLLYLPDQAFHDLMVEVVRQRAEREHGSGQSAALAFTLNAVLHQAHAAHIVALDAALFDLEIAAINLAIMPSHDVTAEIERLTPHRQFWRFRILEGLQRLAENATKRTKR